MLVVLLFVLHFVLAAAIVAGVNALGLIPWRRARDAHWTERARRLWPLRRANGVLLFALPLFFATLQVVCLPDAPLPFLAAAVAGLMGVYLGMWPTSHALFPNVKFAQWVRHPIAAFAIFGLGFGIYLAAAFLMPARWGPATVLVTAATVLAVLCLNFGALLRLLRVTGLLAAAPPRLTAIVRETADRMRVATPRCGVLRSYLANAVALPLHQTLLFTQGALELLADDEVAAISAHELAHLNEPKRVVAARVASGFTLLPVIFFRPVVENFGIGGYLGIIVAIVAFSRTTTAFRRRMEGHADAAAIAHDDSASTAGAYARALEHLYEFNYTPAVVAGSISHPNLYDRMLAAGVTPAYPRPAPAPKYGLAYFLAMAMLSAGMFVLLTRLEPRLLGGH